VPAHAVRYESSNQALEVAVHRTEAGIDRRKLPPFPAKRVELFLTDGGIVSPLVDYVLVLPSRRHENHRRLNAKRRWCLAKGLGDLWALEWMWHMHPRFVLAVVEADVAAA